MDNLYNDEDKTVYGRREKVSPLIRLNVTG